VKEQFYEKLKQLFVGERIEGNSGFVNLYKIKSEYYDNVFPKIQEFIDNEM